MWPIWLVVVVAACGAVTLTVSGIIVAVQIERKRHRRLMTQHNLDLDRNLSQYQRPHLSITDVDITNLPRPARSQRQSVQSARRDSRFYSTMPSEDEIKSYPDGSAESLAEASYIHTDDGPSRAYQWLSPSKSKKKDKRKKKAPQLSISAPMARSPLSAVSERTESVRHESPEPVELPTRITPRVTPERQSKDHQMMPQRQFHGQQDPIDSVLGNTKQNKNRVSQRISHGTALKSRSIGLGSINAPPPDCPLPPVPDNMPAGHVRNSSLSRSKSDLSTQHRDISLLNSPLTTKENEMSVQPGLGRRQTKAGHGFSGFDFGLDNGTIQVIKIEPDRYDAEYEHTAVITRAQGLRSAPATSTEYAEDTFKTIDASGWNAPRGFRNFGPSTPTLSPSASEPGSRPISAISTGSYTDGTVSGKGGFEPPSRPVSISSVDMFRNSVMGSHAPALAPDSPRSRGHKRQNCVRISGLTPIDASKKRLSSQLRRLSETEEIDPADRKSVGIDIPTMSPLRRLYTPEKGQPVGNSLVVPKARQPQGLSLRVKRPGPRSLRDVAPAPTMATDTSAKPNTQPSPLRQNVVTRNTTVEPKFVYQGSPASDPTKPAPPPQELSPVLRSASPVTPQKKQPATLLTYSPASPSMLFSTSPIREPSDSPTSASSRRRVKTQLHGPRTAPPPSLRTRNKTSPRLRQTSERSGSPIRKSSSSQKRCSTSQDELRKSVSLLKNLTHAARSSSGLPEVNVIKSHPSNEAIAANSPTLVARTPSSRYADSPAISNPQPARGARQRAGTVGAGNPHRVAPSMFDPPRLRPEMTFPPPHQQAKENPPALTRFPYSPSNISIWEDASVKGDGGSDSPEMATKTLPAQSRRSTSKPRITGQTTPTSKSAEPVQRESLWKLQQNADMVTSRALALGGNRTPSMTQMQSQKGQEKKKSALDGYWGSKIQTAPPQRGQDPVKMQAPIGSEMERMREQIRRVQGESVDWARNVTSAPRALNGDAAAAYGSIGARKRSHTVAANGRPAAGYATGGHHKVKTSEGIGLGVDFGRTGLGAGLGQQTFLNEMERDGIGRLR